MSPTKTGPFSPSVLSIIKMDDLHAVTGELFLPRHLFKLHLSAQAIQQGSRDTSDRSVILWAVQNKDNGS